MNKFKLLAATFGISLLGLASIVQADAKTSQFNLPFPIPTNTSSGDCSSSLKPTVNYSLRRNGSVRMNLGASSSCGNSGSSSFLQSTLGDLLNSCSLGLSFSNRSNMGSSFNFNYSNIGQLVSLGTTLLGNSRRSSRAISRSARAKNTRGSSKGIFGFVQPTLYCGGNQSFLGNISRLNMSSFKCGSGTSSRSLLKCLGNLTNNQMLNAIANQDTYNNSSPYENSTNFTAGPFTAANGPAFCLNEAIAVSTPIPVLPSGGNGSNKLAKDLRSIYSYAAPMLSTGGLPWAAIEFEAPGHVDTDGSPNFGDSATGQSQTTYVWAKGGKKRYANSDAISGFVVPIPASYGSQKVVELGDMARIEYNGNYIFAMHYDRGPTGEVGELSRFAIAKLSNKQLASQVSASSGAITNVKYCILPGSSGATRANTKTTGGAASVGSGTPWPEFPVDGNWSAWDSQVESSIQLLGKRAFEEASSSGALMAGLAIDAAPASGGLLPQP